MLGNAAEAGLDGHRGTVFEMSYFRTAEKLGCGFYMCKTCNRHLYIMGSSISKKSSWGAVLGMAHEVAAVCSYMVPSSSLICLNQASK